MSKRKGFEMSLRLVIGIVVLIVVGLIVITIVSSYLMKTGNRADEQTNQTIGGIQDTAAVYQCKTLNSSIGGKAALCQKVGDMYCWQILGATDPGC